MREEFQRAVGLIEGEGSITVWTATWNTNKQKYARLSIGSTDIDVLRKFFRVVSVGRINGGRKGYIKKNKDGRKRKPIWDWSVSGVVAENLCKAMLPFLGKRRRQKAKEVLKEVKIWQTTQK